MIALHSLQKIHDDAEPRREALGTRLIRSTSEYFFKHSLQNPFPRTRFLVLYKTAKRRFVYTDLGVPSTLAINCKISRENTP